MGKKRGEITVRIFEDKNKQAKIRDYSNAPKRTLKATVIEAVTVNPIKRGTYIKLMVDKQNF